MYFLFDTPVTLWDVNLLINNSRITSAILLPVYHRAHNTQCPWRTRPMPTVSQPAIISRVTMQINSFAPNVRVKLHRYPPVIPSRCSSVYAQINLSSGPLFLARASPVGPPHMYVIYIIVLDPDCSRLTFPCTERSPFFSDAELHSECMYRVLPLFVSRYWLVVSVSALTRFARRVPMHTRQESVS